MDARPLISVIIPMYNSKDYIEETLQSVLDQTYRNFEIIVIDDGSTDGSGDIVKKMQDKHKNIYYIYQCNSGVSTARNVGLKFAKGEYIAFLDSDDLWLREKLEKQIKRLLDTGYDACYCGTIDYFEDRNIYIKEKISFYNGKVLIPFLKDKFWGQTGTWIVKKRLILDNKILFNETCNWGEDFEFFFKVMALGNVTCVEDYLFIYRRRSNSLSKFSFSKFQEIDVWNRLKSWVVSIDDLEYEKKKIINIIDNFRLPSAVIKIIFESLEYNNHYSHDQFDYFEKKYKLSSYIKSFKPFIGDFTMTFKILLYRYAIKYRFFYTIFRHLKKIKFFLK